MDLTTLSNGFPQLFETQDPNQMSCKRLNEEYEDLVIDLRTNVRSQESFRSEKAKLASAASRKNCKSP